MQKRKIFGGRQLRNLIERHKRLRFLEAHNGLTGLIVENAQMTSAHGKQMEFDGIWSSSLTESLIRRKPDISVVDFTSRLHSLQQIAEVTTKPILVDADNGGTAELFPYHVRSFENSGISSIVIEDKVGHKQNSLLGRVPQQSQDSIAAFSRKISIGKSAQRTKDFMIFARIESLVLEAGMQDALQRARSYLASGADGILIHSKSARPDEIIEFASGYHQFAENKPLIAVPTTYSSTTEDELWAAGIHIVIYANQLLRSGYKAMLESAQLILKHSRALEADKDSLSIPEVLRLVPHL